MLHAQVPAARRRAPFSVCVCASLRVRMELNTCDNLPGTLRFGHSAWPAALQIGRGVRTDAAGAASTKTAIVVSVVASAARDVARLLTPITLHAERVARGALAAFKRRDAAPRHWTPHQRPSVAACRVLEAARGLGWHQRCGTHVSARRAPRRGERRAGRLPTTMSGASCRGACGGCRRPSRRRASPSERARPESCCRRQQRRSRRRTRHFRRGRAVARLVVAQLALQLRTCSAKVRGSRSGLAPPWRGREDRLILGLFVTWHRDEA